MLCLELEELTSDIYILPVEETFYCERNTSKCWGMYANLTKEKWIKVGYPQTYFIA